MHQGKENQSYFNIDISNRFGPEYIPMIEDMARMVTIQLIIQILVVLSGGASSLAEFVLLTMYVVLGVAMYWLVMRSVVSFS
jgi:hypothetical protein